jgi:hypothetical protein
MGRSHTTEQRARKDGPQAHGSRCSINPANSKAIYRRNIEKIENSRLKTMLIMMQVTIGK